MQPIQGVPERELTGKIGLNLADFPARFACGSIFWSRGSALKPLRFEAASRAFAFRPTRGINAHKARVRVS
jgi:hypothetical protein